MGDRDSDVKNAKFVRGRPSRRCLCIRLAITGFLGHLEGQTSPGASIRLILTIFVCYSCFEPAEFSIALHADVATKLLEHVCSVDVKGYSLAEWSPEEFGKGGSIVYQKFTRTPYCESPKSVLKGCWKEEEKEGKE